MQRSRSPILEYFPARSSMCRKQSLPCAINFARVKDSIWFATVGQLGRGGLKGRTWGSSPFACGSSRYIFTPLSQRNVLVRNIKGHVSQSNGYATYCHQCELKASLDILTGSSSRNWRSSSSQRPPRSCRIPSAQPYRPLEISTSGLQGALGEPVPVPVACLRGHGSPIPSYQASLRRKSIRKPQDRVSLPRRQPSRGLPRTE